MSKTDMNNYVEKTNWFHIISGKAKAALCIGALTLGTAAMPVHAESTTDNDGPWSDDLSEASTTRGTDKTFANLFSSWKKLDKADAGTPEATIYIPTGRPVDDVKLTSSFGARSDPFNGRRRMHKGIDIPGPVGTPIYATADGIVSRSQWVRGYGKFIEIAHGNDTQTRFGHLSKLIVKPNARVRRGQIIGLMGSTGRSTGSHLHYEIRVSGVAINPLPYITGSERAMALNSRPSVALGGPTAREEIAAK